MSKSYVYIEPSVIGYQEDVSSLDSTKMEEFILELDRTLKLLSDLKYTIILNGPVLASIVRSNPTIPFDLYNIGDYKLRTIADTLHKKMRMTVSSEKVVVVNGCPSCSVSPELVYSTPDNYLNFIELLLSSCTKICTTTSEIILKNLKSIFFRNNSFVLTCDGSCNNLFTKVFQCSTCDDIESNNKLKLVEYQIADRIINNRYDPDIEVEQDEHHSVFYKKVKSLKSIPSPEKELFNKLNQIVDIKSIHFREFLATVDRDPACLYDFMELENSLGSNYRIKASLSLERRGSKPQGCRVEMIVEKDMFSLLCEYMKLNNQSAISIDFLDELLKVVRNS